MTFPFDARGKHNPLSESEMDEVMPASSPAKPAIVRDEEQEETPEQITNRQFRDAVLRIHEDTTQYPRFPWSMLDEIAGPMAPCELWLFCARTGNGKTLFLLNLWAALVEQAKRIGLYIGLEQTAMEMRIKWACTMTGVLPSGPLAGKWPHHYTPDRIAHDNDLVQAHLKRQKGELREMAHFSDSRFITADGLKRATEWAVDHDAEFVIVDHLNRVDTGGGRSAFEGHSRVVRTAKELAVDNSIVMLCASQMGRPSGDPCQRFMPPALHEMRGGGTSEEEANTVLGIFRPLKPEVTEKMMTEVRQGRREESTIYQEDMMAVRVLKHRLDGLQLGNQALLRVEKGRVLNRYG